MNDAFPEKIFLDAIKARDIIRLRAMIKAILMEDPADSGGLAERCLSLAKGRVREVLEPHSASIVMETDRSKWTTGYRDYAAGALLMNFSQERFLHLVEDGKHVYPARLRPAKREARRMSSKQRNALVAAALGLVSGFLILQVNTILGVVIIIGSIALGLYGYGRCVKE